MMLNNNPYSEVKGFNYWPSYAMVLNDVMDRFDLEIVKRELKGAQNREPAAYGCGSAM